ncbi:MAG: hypothetical protein ACRYF2_02470 [Janthinobacterium lividum]
MSAHTVQHTPVARGRSRFCLRVQLSGTDVRPYRWEIFDDEDAKVIRRSAAAFRTSADAWAAGVMVLNAG